MNKTIRIGTRKSALAMVQTELVAEALKQVQPGLETRRISGETSRRESERWMKDSTMPLYWLLRV